jgi:hypothetical protein
VNAEGSSAIEPWLALKSPWPVTTQPWNESPIAFIPIQSGPQHCRGRRTSRSPREGEEQLRQYVTGANQQDFAPFGFMSNGLNTFFGKSAWLIRGSPVSSRPLIWSASFSSARTASASGRHHQTNHR